jgi:hypothetical protein
LDHPVYVTREELSEKEKIAPTLDTTK